MSTGDAFVMIECDDCGTFEQAGLPFVYSGTMHTDGRYDHNHPRLPQGWAAVGDDKHRCSDCAEAEADPA